MLSAAPVLRMMLLVVCVAAPVRSEVIWSDEFNGEHIDRTVWSYHTGGHGFGNGQLEYNTDRPENSFVKNGNLVIEAHREVYEKNQFTSARMVTQGRFAFQYGRLEARIKMPDTADGVWPAFWMLGNNYPKTPWPQCGEIDIVEIGSKEGILAGQQRRRINSALHFANKDDHHDMRVAWHDAASDLNADFHIYKVDWTPERLACYLDDAEIASWDITGDEFREFHQPHFLLLNIAIGGKNPSYTGVYAPDKVTATLPCRMYVDWIRLHRHQQTEITTKL